AMRFCFASFGQAAGGGVLVSAGTARRPGPHPPLCIEPQTFREAAGPDFSSTDITNTPTECDQRLQLIAVIELLPRLVGPDACGGTDMVRLQAVVGVGGARIELTPTPVLRCPFAESLAGPLRHHAT